MHILLVGASGTIGQAIEQELRSDCKIIAAGFSSGDIQVDLSNSDSIAKMYDAISQVDAVVCAAARGVVFAPIETMTRQHYVNSMQSKLLGQVDLVIQGLTRLQGPVSFTLTTGLLNQDPIAQGTAAAMVNGAVEAFVKAAAIDLPGKQRINVVSPALLEESKTRYGDFFPGHQTVAGQQVALAYRKAIMGRMNGEILRVGW